MQPHKKSINLGIFKHPGGNIPTLNAAAASTFEPPTTPHIVPESGSSRRRSSGRNDATNAAKKLQELGLILILWIGRCEAEKVAMGKYDVPADQGGMYAVVFDNTFSKQLSKTATLVLMTYPTNSPPLTSHHAHHLQAAATAAATSPSSSTLGRHALDSSDSVHESALRNEADSGASCPLSGSDNGGGGPADSHAGGSAPFVTGMLLKRRRKRHQGWGRRFFSLDFASATLSYYHNRHSSALRGAIPLSLAVIGANAKTREISVDSGAEVWHLRALSAKDFAAWRQALERASGAALHESAAAAAAATAADASAPAVTTSSASGASNLQDEQEWARLESLVGRVAGIRDAVRRLASSTKRPRLADMPANSGKLDSPDPTPTEFAAAGDYLHVKPKHSLWKRKSSGGTVALGLFGRSSPGRVGSPTTAQHAENLPPSRLPGPASDSGNADMHAHCQALLRDLDSVVAGFTDLIAESKQRRAPMLTPVVSRQSTDTFSTDEFFDADDGKGRNSQLLKLNNSDAEENDDDDEEEEERGDELMDDVDDDDDDDDDDRSDSSSSSDRVTPDGFDSAHHHAHAPQAPHEPPHALFPCKSDSLAPLPLAPVPRRRSVPPAAATPPSRVGFLRKNVGKDLAAIAMPVSANEPLSLLQRYAEQLEYAPLLERAAAPGLAPAARLLHVAAFAVAALSGHRARERALRKPFNPMLGETFECVREDLGFRFVAEKVTHRPVRLACHADGRRWAWAQSAAPTQKFWGKSMELVTDGRVRVVLYTGGGGGGGGGGESGGGSSNDSGGKGGGGAGGERECFSWTPATCFLRNLLAGEKYVEPVGSMTVLHETSGAKAVVTFRAKGLFSGRSEDVVVRAFGGDGRELPAGLVGKWTSALTVAYSGGSSSSSSSAAPAPAPAPSAAGGAAGGGGGSGEGAGGMAAAGTAPADGSVIWQAGALVDGAAARYGFTALAASLNEVTRAEAGRLPPTDSRLRPDQRAAEQGELERAEALKQRLEEAQRARRQRLDAEGREWRPRWFERVYPPPPPPPPPPPLSPPPPSAAPASSSSATGAGASAGAGGTAPSSPSPSVSSSSARNRVPPPPLALASTTANDNTTNTSTTTTATANTVSSSSHSSSSQPAPHTGHAAAAAAAAAAAGRGGGGGGGVASLGAVDEGEEVWRLRTGRSGYWEERERGAWTDVVDVFAV